MIYTIRIVLYALSVVVLALGIPFAAVVTLLSWLGKKIEQLADALNPVPPLTITHSTSTRPPPVALDFTNGRAHRKDSA